MTSIARSLEIDVAYDGTSDVIVSTCDEEQMTWKVWVELPSGAYRLWSTLTGTEGDAISSALAETGAAGAFAQPELKRCDEFVSPFSEVGLGPQSTSPGDAEPPRGAATGGES
jgi:hypothetical protein